MSGPRRTTKELLWRFFVWKTRGENKIVRAFKGIQPADSGLSFSLLAPVTPLRPASLMSALPVVWRT